MKRRKRIYMRGRKLRYRRKGYSRPYGKSRIKRGGNRPEIKYYDIIVTDQAVVHDQSATVVNTLQSGSTIIVNALQRIKQGLNYNNRIGNKIYVMKAKFYGLVWICPASSDTKNYNSVQFRYMVTDAQSLAVGDPPAPGNVTDFWSNALAKCQIFGAINRKSYHVYNDRYMNLTAGFPNNGNSATSVTAGAIRYFTFSTPLNRYVTYRPDGFPKEDYNCLTYHMMATAPNVNTNGTQLGCLNFRIRIYYKDA